MRKYLSFEFICPFADGNGRMGRMWHSRLLSALGNDTLSAAELMKRLGLSHRPTFRKNYLHPALEQNQIERTHDSRQAKQPESVRLMK